MTPIPQRDIDTFGGGSIPKNPDPVAAFKERLKEKVNERIKFDTDEIPILDSKGHSDAVVLLQNDIDVMNWVKDLIDETK